MTVNHGPDSHRDWFEPRLGSESRHFVAAFFVIHDNALTMSHVYILFSKKNAKYYVGFTTESVADRLVKHNEGYYDDKWTEAGKPWDLVFTITCENPIQARKIERHIKSMKSTKYIENLIKYPEMTQKLLLKFSDC